MDKEDKSLYDIAHDLVIVYIEKKATSEITIDDLVQQYKQTIEQIYNQLCSPQR